MILIWKGWGIVVPIAIFCSVMVTNGALRAVLTNADPQALNLLGNALSFGLVVPLFVAFNMYLDQLDAPDPDYAPVDPRTGAPERIPSQHTFFWIPMKYWAIPCAGIALYSLVCFVSVAMSISG